MDMLPYRADRALLNWIERLSDTQFVYLMLLPVLILLGSMAIWPLVETFRMSLHADNLTSSNATGIFVGLDNYVKLLSGDANILLPSPFLDLSKPLASAVPVTLIFTAIAVGVETIIGFGMALVLNKQFRARRWVRVCLILPWAVPVVIQGMIFYLMFTPGVGFAVEPLQQLGLISGAPLSDGQSTLIVVILSDIWKQSAFMALLILAGLQSVDRSLYNVAKVTGASKFQQFRTITFPLVLPTLLIALLFRTIAALKVYGTVVTVANCNTLPTLTCLVVTTWNANRFASAAAIAFIMALVIGLSLLGYLFKLRNMDYGGI
ncbi:carbohydrate ABC transporter permease [Halegenticoccus tardaugens]|uniref:carbohydrate ABC transporter permease n=1 Tax=Halegenticoccus tardaugens TaxID=2071624 RepID=UPI00374465C6